MIYINFIRIKKLIAHGYLNDASNISPESNITKPLLVQRIIKTICQCFDGPDIDENVQLQVIKSLLTILTSPYIEVHEQTLLLPIKTCYNIQISSRSLINQASARAALTQIINTILLRFETSSSKKRELIKKEKTERLTKDLELTSRLSTQTNSNQASQFTFLNGHNKNKGDDSLSLNDSNVSTTGGNEIGNEMENDANLNEILNTEHYKHIYMDILRNFECEQLNFNLAQTVEELNAMEETNGLISEVMCSMLETVCEETEASILDAKLAEENLLNNMNKLDMNASISTSSSTLNPKDPELVGIDDPFELDAYLMFRVFCKLSLRPVSQETNNADIKNSIDVKSKILSLQLILATLQNAKASFKQSKFMINAIRRYLCVSLTRNGVSPMLDVFELSLAIFVALLADYKQHLKKQIEVFFREIIIFLLETPSASFDHKWLVVQALTHVCANAQCVVDLYINYDCDLQSTNIFARLVNVLSKKAQARQAITATPLQARSIRLKSLECLVSILKCMVEWSKDLFVNSNSVQSNLGAENRPQIDNEHLDLASSNKINSYNSENSLASSGSTGNKFTYNPTDFEMLKSKKELWEKGIDLFNKKPKKGIQFLQENELLGKSVEDIAKFLVEDERLDKTSIGDFLGENEKFNKEVMYSYVDQMDFYGMEIVSALRLFLEGFRLPGEAQKIDRLMEKFAARYHELNKKFASIKPQEEQILNSKRLSGNRRILSNYYFESADAVYVLAFSIIMLATDLHSPSVKKKMTKENYINMNKGINDSKDLPRDFLEGIYDQVAESELKLKGNTNTMTTPGKKEAESEKQRQLLYNMEIEQVVQTARSLMESMCHVSTNFTSAKHGEHIMPMFKLAWTPFLAAFSIGLQDSDDKQVVELCLNGIRCAIRISCIFHLELERNAYMQALSRFTLLAASSPITEMKSKNFECVKILILIAHTDGNYLGKSWYDILKCISQLELSQSIGLNIVNTTATHTNAQSSNSSLNANSASAASLSSNATSRESSILNSSSISNTSALFPSLSDESKSLSNIHIGESQSVTVAVDRIFTGSVRLDGDAIVEFVKWLCYVSDDELASNPPRMYSLQKIVEISYYNMGRIRLQWTRIWNVLGEHFNKAGCNPNEEVAFFAVDSLRQLTMKFLEKGEFANFRFQKDFLRPFEHIMKKNGSYTIRDMVVQCIAQMIKSQAQNIRSGWKNVFGVFHIAASQNNDRIINFTFDCVSEIVRSYAEKYFTNIIDSFQDSIKCLSEFACNSMSPDISIEAIGLIRHCAMFVAEKPDIFIEKSGEDIKNIPECDLVWMKGWFPILFELSCIINRCKLDVRTR